ncbi:molybdopterin-dependent oxidoreductase [Moritella viscosa]|uniref:Trimethylamine-N-oxide reductase n=1 Tax=Moritella viscosa TaxID=80854 RepID=A0ABY1HID6_9GAMM|nr:molybdopterin-dependent oxidoreductase [Moritella viscosa]SGZ00811.1 Trimethylamine-N-oxide reductase [Moritella viscosa]SGZ16054.1 Trimethylamine-N-oxide reductase [Moritella viscosa]SHO28703.1 Trimethylamine-N-oxide reductase [Moritella viscosa]
MSISRRNFLKSSLAAAGAVPALTLFGPKAVFAKDIELIPHATHYGAFNAVVKDGKLIGVQTLSDIDALPTKMLTEGVLSRTYHETRVNYPMVRKSYLEGMTNGTGDTKVELRGKEEFVRVSWDVALGLTAKAILDTIDKAGNEGIFSSSYGGWSHAGVFRPNVLQGRFFNMIGGCSLTSGDYSGGASQISLPHIIGDMEVYSPQTAWEQVRDNTQVFCMIGCDPFKNNRVEYRVADHQMYPRWEAIKNKGIKFVSINPQFTITDEALDCEWVKIIPGTDTALFLSMCHYLYKNDLHDEKYLNTYTVGFDKFLPSLLGKDGSEEKTPKWASKITGIPEAKIIELAKMFSDNRTQFAGSWSLQRQDHGEMQHWAIIAFSSMLGGIGKPGEGVGFSWHYGCGGMPVSGKSTPAGLSQGRNLVKTYCPASRITEMLNNPGVEFTHNGSTHKYPLVKMIYNSGNNFMSHQQDTNKLIKALQSVDTVVCQDPWWCASTRWSDIVLPATTTVERNDITSGGTYSNDKVYAMRQIIKPQGESLDDIEIFRRLSSLFNVEYQFMEQGQSVMQMIEAAYAKSSATMPFKEFWEKGIAHMEVPLEANKWVRHGDFYTDPVKNPLATTSGKIELYSSDFAKYKLDDCPPIPTFFPPHEYLGNAEEDELHVVSPHPRMRLHSQMANTSIRDIDNIQGREPCLMSPEDAKSRGIKDGDLIEVYNKRGSILVGARVDPRIMKGVISIYEGCWPSVDSKGRCNSGLVNFITSDKASSGLSQATTANTVLVKMKKCTDPDGPNEAYTKPAIIDKSKAEFAIAYGLGRVSGLKAKATADLGPGEKIFYQRCTVCHGPKDTTHFTKLQWKGITKSMFPRAGLNPEEQGLVLDFLMKNAKDAI